MATTSTGATAAPPKPRTKLLAALRKPSSSDSTDSSADSASDASDIEDTHTPTKPSQRLHIQVRSPVHEEEEEEEVDTESAYLRMKQRLAAEKDSREQQGQKPVPVQESVISSDEEEPLPVRKPVRKLAENTRSSPRALSSPNAPSRRSSPGLFVSPGPSPAKKRSPFRAAAGSDSDEATQETSATDLQERVKRIRAQRLARQEAARSQTTSKDAASDDDAEVDRRLTQQSKPTRRAGKKAMEAMARDQQRISRNMQLTHQAKTKKRHTTKDLFAKFGFTTPGEEESTAPPTPEKTAGLVSSDIEAQAMHDTPPTSPPRQDDPAADIGESTPKATVIEMADETTPVPSTLDKGKGRAPEFAHLPTRWPSQAQPLVVRRVQNQPVDDTMVELSDSEDETEQTPKSRFAVFDRVRTKEQNESNSFVTLRHLAHLTTSKQTRNGPNVVSRSEMHFSLAQRARQQAQKAREEKIDELKRRGIHVETSEEREKHQMEVEDLVAQFEKQRQEDLKLAKMEKKEAKANGETDELPSSDEDDEDYVGSGEENAAGEEDEQEDEEEMELELSGSEDEPMEDEDADEDAGARPEDVMTVDVDEGADDDDEPSLPVRKSTTVRSRRVVEDDDESGNEAEVNEVLSQQATQDDGMAAFGFGRSSPGPGLTQMFAGTMANLNDSQATQETQQDSLDFLRSLPDTQPGVNFSQANDTLVPDSQLFATPRKPSQAGVETQFSLGIGGLFGPSPSKTQLSEAPEPTQDAGFSFSRSPAGFAPISTVETVMMSVAESPIKTRTGKLHRRRREATAELSDAGDVNTDIELSDVDDIQRPPKHRDAFRAMQKGAKKQKAIDAYNKKTSAAKDIVEEQADESEDEYAGIGGASDDDSGEEDEELKNMIDASDVQVDERQIAAFYA